MAAQVVQEAAGGGDGVGAAAVGLRGGAGGGPGQAEYVRGVVDQRVAGFLDDAGARRDVRAESGRVRGTARLRGDVVQFPPFRGGVAVVRDQPEQAAGLGVHDRVDRVEHRRPLVRPTVAAGYPQVVGGATVVGDLHAAGQPLAEQPGRADQVRETAPHRPSRSSEGGGPSPGSSGPGSGDGIAAREVVPAAGRWPGRCGASRSQAPRPPAARPAAFPATCQPSPLRPGASSGSGTGRLPAGGANRAGSSASGGLIVTVVSSKRVSSWPSKVSSRRSRMPVSPSTISSTRSPAGGRRLVPDPTAPCRGTAVTAIASRPQAVTGPPTSRVNRASRPAGRNRAGTGNPGPFSKSRGGSGAASGGRSVQACSPSDPSARPPWSPSYSRRYRRPGAISRAACHR